MHDAESTSTSVPAPGPKFARRIPGVVVSSYIDAGPVEMSTVPETSLIVFELELVIVVNAAGQSATPLLSLSATGGVASTPKNENVISSAHAGPASAVSRAKHATAKTILLVISNHPSPKRLAPNIPLSARFRQCNKMSRAGNG